MIYNSERGKRFFNTFYIRESTKKRIQLLAKEKRLSLGEIIDLVVDLYPWD